MNDCGVIASTELSLATNPRTVILAGAAGDFAP
jgi:hypothetical protein